MARHRVFSCAAIRREVDEGFTVRCGLRPPRTHDLEVLADTLAAFLAVDTIREAALVLTEYAVDARYPGTDVDADEATQAVAYAECVQRWAETAGL